MRARASHLSKHFNAAARDRSDDISPPEYGTERPCSPSKCGLQSAEPFFVSFYYYFNARLLIPGPLCEKAKAPMLGVRLTHPLKSCNAFRAVPVSPHHQSKSMPRLSEPSWRLLASPDVRRTDPERFAIDAHAQRVILRLVHAASYFDTDEDRLQVAVAIARLVSVSTWHFFPPRRVNI